MSNQAITWATQQRTGRSVVKFLLVAIANYCDDEGKCWPSQATLARDTEMSIDSVQRHMKELERLGLLYRTPRRQEHGYRAPDYLILLMNEDAQTLAAVHGWSPVKPGECGEDDDADGEENDPHCEGGEDDKAADCGLVKTESLSRNQPEPKPHCCGLDTKAEPSKNHNPLPPSDQKLAGKGSADEEAGTEIQPSRSAARALRKWEEDADEFEDLWPFERDEAKDPCRRWFRTTPPEDRRKVLAAARRYLADIRRRNAKRCAAKRFLREKVWEGYVEGAAPTTSGDRVFVRVDTDAWAAWAATRPGRSWPVTDHRLPEGKLVRGWWFPTLFPPATARDGPQAA